MLDRRTFLTCSLTGALVGGYAIDRGYAAAPSRLIRSPRTVFREGKNLSADVVVYGATPAGIAAAIAAADQGASVLLVGGWRERHLGGMMGGGLGWTDVENVQAYGGFSRETIQTIAGKGMPGNPFAFNPVRARRIFADRLRAAGVAFVRSEGVVDVRKSDRAVASFATADGRQFSGRTFIDASYEGDLLARAGISYRVGREARSKQNPLSGLMGAHVETGASLPLWRRAVVDPFRVEGDADSGLLHGVNHFDPADRGRADKAVQAYTFRLLMSNRPDKRVDLPATPPLDYRAERYEPHLRYIAAIEKAGLQHGRDWSFTKDIVKPDEVSDGVFDVNSRGYFSTDHVGGSWDYPDADYVQRERIWKDHEAYLRGLFFTWGWSDDPRLPETFKREVRSWGLARDCFDDPFAADGRDWPYQLYVREARRLDNGLEWSGQDLDTADDRAVRAGNIIAMASYMQDSHATQRVATRLPDGRWALINEGGFSVRTGGKDGFAPLPFELIVPHQDQCTNMLSVFCVASSHQAFSSIRMEMTSMAVGQAAGLASALAVSGDRATAFQQIGTERLQPLIVPSGSVVEAPSKIDELIRKIEKRLGAA